LNSQIRAPFKPTDVVSGPSRQLQASDTPVVPLEKSPSRRVSALTDASENPIPLDIKNRFPYTQMVIWISISTMEMHRDGYGD
jgi:hypothetical protein